MRLYGTLQELTSLVIRLASGKTVKIQADEQTAAGETQITIPNVGDGADELVLKDTAVIMTNKTLTAPVMTSAQIDSSSKIVLPATASPAQTATGSMVWDSAQLLLTIGKGSGAPKVLVDTDSIQVLTGKTLSGGTVTSASIANPTMSGVTINSATRIALTGLPGMGNGSVLISDANGDLTAEPQLSKSRGGTGSILTNVDFPQNVTSKIITNIAELTSAKLDRAAPAIATSVLTPSANKAVVQRIATAANFNEIANPEDGRYYIIMNASATDITIGNETGTAANQIVTGTGAAFTFKAGTSIAAVYDGGSSKWRLSGGAGGAGGGTTDVITQVGHGFAVGDAVYLAGLVYTHAIATAANTAEVVGVVSKVVSNDAFELTLSGEISGLTGLTPGEVYFLGVNPVTPGKLTIVEPSVVGQVSLPVGVASSASTLYVAPKRGVVVGAANARTTISINNAAVTPVVDVTNYNSLKLEGELFVSRTGGNQRAYYTVEAAKNGAGVWQVSASYTGDDILYVTLPSWDVAANQLQITMPLVTGPFLSASLTYALNAPAVGASLPLAIDSSSLNIVDSAPLSYRNRIINGDMRIDQRNAGASVTNTSGALFPVDRFSIEGIASSKFSGQQSAVAPSGFSNSLLITSLAATALGASDYYLLRQKIEGFNVADLGWGTASAQTVTFSFWVRSSLTGTFGGALQNADQSRAYPFSYTINAVNTWEQKTVTVAGDTTGTWNSSNGTGVMLTFSLGVGASKTAVAGSWAAGQFWSATGSQSVVGTNGATFYITGVQLEVGSKASAFERRPYGMELGMCQRYFFKTLGSIWLCRYATAGYSIATISFPVPMRVSPLIGSYTQTNNQSAPAQSASYYGSGMQLIYQLEPGNGFELSAFSASAEL